MLKSPSKLSSRSDWQALRIARIYVASCVFLCPLHAISQITPHSPVLWGEVTIDKPYCLL